MEKGQDKKKKRRVCKEKKKRIGGNFAVCAIGSSRYMARSVLGIDKVTVNHFIASFFSLGPEPMRCMVDR